MRLIDADELKYEIFSSSDFMNMMNAHIQDVDIIDKMPTVDTVEHAHWIKTDGAYCPDWIYCSSCGYIPSKTTAYCPRCGAKMDEVAE